MSLGCFKKRIIESITKEIIRGIVQEVDAEIQISPDLTLEGALRLVNKRRGVFAPSEEAEEDIKDWGVLFGIMVLKAYRWKRAFDPDSASIEHTTLVVEIARDYINMVSSKTKDDFKKLLDE